VKAFGIGVLGFVLMAAVAYGGLLTYNRIQVERTKEAILVDLACQSPLTKAKFGVQCAAAPAATNVSPPGPPQ